MKVFYRFSRALFRGYFSLFHRYKVYGLNHIPKGAAILAPNHASFWDPPIIGASFPEEVHFLARASLFQHGMLSSVITRLNAHPIQGGSTHDLASLKLILELLHEGKKVVVFPEGVRSPDGELAAIKPGIAMLALRAGVPVIPIYIHGAYRAWPRSRRFPRLWNKIACVIGKPIAGDAAGAKERKVQQQKMAGHVAASIRSLRDWYVEGAHGNPP